MKVLLATLLMCCSASLVAEEAPLDVETILREAPSPDDYAGDVRCLSLGRIREVKALDDRHVTFKVGRDTYYLVQLAHRCPGLRKNSTVAYETTHSMSICRLDSIRGTFNFGSVRLGPRCSIPRFQKVTREQLALLKEALKKG